jgi:hypothetical protein
VCINSRLSLAKLGSLRLVLSQGGLRNQVVAKDSFQRRSTGWTWYTGQWGTFWAEYSVLLPIGTAGTLGSAGIREVITAGPMKSETLISLYDFDPAPVATHCGASRSYYPDQLARLYCICATDRYQEFRDSIPLIYNSTPRYQLESRTHFPRAPPFHAPTAIITITSIYNIIINLHTN